MIFPAEVQPNERVALLNHIKANPDVILTLGSMGKATGINKNRVRTVIDILLAEGWITRKAVIKHNNNYIRYHYSIAEGVTIR